MEATEEGETMCDQKEVESDVPDVPDTMEIKIPRAKIRVAIDDRTPTVSPTVKIMMRQSTDSQLKYEIVRKGKRLIDSSELLPTVQLKRYDDLSAESSKEKALNNGLDPIAVELISSASIASSKAGSEYSDRSDETHGFLKISREMKNLQKSTNDSKILSDYLSTSTMSPRNRNRKNKDAPIVDPDELEEPEQDNMDFDTEIFTADSPMSLANENADSDSTMVLPMEPPDKRRKSVSRSRNRSRSTVRSRKKSIARLMQDELSVTSDKDEANEEDEDDHTSEVSFVTNRPLEGRAVNPPPKPGWDSFCFKCHTDTAVLSLACSKCKCSYHRHCVRPNPIPKNADEFECTECRELDVADASGMNKYGHEKIDANTLADMLTIILEKIRTYPDREHFENDIVVKGVKEPTQPFIVTQMSLKTLETRIKAHYYKTTEAFIHDIKQLEHNWNIVDRSKSKTLKTIVKYVNTEINELEACVYCYEKSFITGEWFVQPCKRPHLLIWAKLKGYPYWPAKVMSVDSRQQVDVRFFGAHDRAWVPAAHCILFSEKDPNKTKGSTPTNTKNASKTQKGIADAMKEKDDYIDNLNKKFGFKYFQLRQQFDPNDLKSQLDFMLPGLNTSKEVPKDGQNGDEKELDGSQKEKLTMKIVKGQSSYQVEQKTSEQRTPSVQKPLEKDKPKLYKVLSKNDDNMDLEQPGRLQPLIIKRKSNVEQETEKSKRSKASDTMSETSESNASTQNGKINSSRRKSVRDSVKHKKLMKNVDKDTSHEPLPKKSKHADKQKPTNDDVEQRLLDEVGKPKTVKRSRAKSALPESDKPLLVALVVPPGTDEIEALREVSASPPANKRTHNRSRSFHRSRSIEKEPLKDTKLSHRISISSPIKRSLSDATRKNSHRDSVAKSPVTEEVKETLSFNPHLVIKDEPVSENEEILQRDTFTLNDIPNLMQDRSGKKKLIVISTNDNGEASSSVSTQQQVGRARKTFPNNPNQSQLEALTSQQLQQARNGNWMICIPQAFTSPAGTSATVQTGSLQSPPTSNRSTPASDSQISISQVRSNQSSTRATPNISTTATNRSLNLNVPPLNYNVNNTNTNSNPSSLHRRNSIHSNPFFINGQRVALTGVSQPNSMQQRNHHPENPPRLVPRPKGVFTNDGCQFNRDIGPVSRLFQDNGHRMSDYFRSLLMDTIASFAPEVPTAENLMLRAENEKINREMQITKSDCQLKMQELRREHQDEIDSIKKEHEDRMKSLQMTIDQEKGRLISEIRHQCEIEKQRAIDMTRKETKKTTWCSNCTKEARFYCCWNTSYCGPQCQKTHWQIHQRCCTNKNSVSDTPMQQVAPKTVNVEPVAAAPQIANRQALVLRSPQQQSTVQSLQHPAVSIQQHIILPSVVTTSLVSSAQPSSMNPFLHNKNRGMLTNFYENALIVKTIPRNESPNLNLISTLPVTESMMLHVNNGTIPTTSQD